MNDTEKYLRTFILDLENERNNMKETLLNYEGRCDQLKIDIDRLNFAITQGKAAIKRIEEDKCNDKEENT
jgi:hypothetical protein